jgi:hypothetical protein
MTKSPEHAKERRSGHRTHRAAKCAVASELRKRGYEVAPTPLADLMVVSPMSKKNFLIDVKGLYKRNSWKIKTKARRENLYYVLAFVPDDTDNHFFILSQEQVNTHVRDELARLGRPDDYSSPGIDWKQAEAHENRWDCCRDKAPGRSWAAARLPRLSKHDVAEIRAARGEIGGVG